MWVKGMEGKEDRCAQFAKASAKEIAEQLKEYQMWRRGEGKYNSDEPDFESHFISIPFSPKELGVIEDRAIELLESI